MTRTARIDAHRLAARSVADQHWRGIGKLTEEAGELLQLCGKAIPFPVRSHPDGKGDMRARFPEEIADLYAALDYFVETNDLPKDGIESRRAEKVAKFKHWELTGIPDADQK